MKESKILNDLRNGERWNEKKKNAETIANAVRQSRFDRELKDKAVLIANCATNLQFAENIKTGQRKLKNANFCRQRLCPMCQWRLAVRRRINFLKTIENIPSANFLFVTLTVRNCAGDELRETMGLLLNSFYKFYRNRLKKQGKKGFCDGYYRSAEVTYNKHNNTYHPHLHVVLAVDNRYFRNNYMKHSEWRLQWQKYLGVDYLSQVSVEKAGDSNVGLTNEICKYVTKPSIYANPDNLNFTAEQFALLDSQLRGIRMVSSSGVFKKVSRMLKLKDAIDASEYADDGNSEDWTKEWYFFDSGRKEYISCSA